MDDQNQNDPNKQTINPQLNNPQPILSTEKESQITDTPSASKDQTDASSDIYGIPIKYALGIAVAAIVLYLVLPLPASYYLGDTIYFFAGAIVAASAGLAWLVRRFIRLLKRI